MSSDSQITLSVIVPVHRVQGYLRECLHSILDEAGPNVEVIAIDDKSPDHCGEILDEFAERDPRVRVKHLTDNVGLGEARNIGLELATGDYVWFFDSDDYADEGAVDAILDRLEETRPDVLVFDYTRSYWNGRVQRSVINSLFREPPAPDVFTLDERPSVLQLMMTAWNKAIRREFLLDLGLRFSGGYYEDINVTYPILMAADRLSLLDRVCYNYRQRRRGAITRTTGRKHFDAFKQYERIFEFMDRQGPKVDKFRSLMFDRTIWHLLIILGRGDRVPHKERAEFFAGISAVYRRYRPADHVLPDDKQLAAKYKLIERNNYTLFQLSKRTNETSIKVKKQLSQRINRKKARRVIGFGKSKLRGLYYRVQRRLPIDENLAVYGAYWFRGYSCNPAAVYEKAGELAPHVRAVWAVTPAGAKTMPEGVDYVVAGTSAYVRAVARAKYFVNNVNFPDDVVKRSRQVHVMTQHGTPLKKMGLDQMDYPVGANDMDFGALINRSDRWDFLISSNPLSSEAWERSFPCHYEMLEIGYPRNDRLVRPTAGERARLRAELGIPEGKKAILYTPTHRDYHAGYRPMFGMRRFVREIGDDYVLLLRAHYYYKRGTEKWASNRVIDVSKHPSIEDLCIASDALLTDYSSIMFDYAVLDDRPIVVYANDWDTYVRTRGVNFDITAMPPGAVATTENELIEVFQSGAAWGDAATKAHTDFRARFCPWDDGYAAERAVRRVFLGERVTPPQ